MAPIGTRDISTKDMGSGEVIDLEAARPGPGQPIKLVASGVDGSVIVVTGPNVLVAYDLMTLLAPVGILEFHLPSNTMRYIKATYLAGTVAIVMDGQTNE